MGAHPEEAALAAGDTARCSDDALCYFSCALLTPREYKYRKGEELCVFCPSANLGVCLLGVVRVLVVFPLPCGLSLCTCPARAAFQFKHYFVLKGAQQLLHVC